MSEVIIDGVPFKMVGFEGIPHPPKPVRVKEPGKRRGYYKKSCTRDFTKLPRREDEKIPGRYDYYCLRIGTQATKYFNKPGFPRNDRTGTRSGMTKAIAAPLWAAAKEKAKEDMSKIKQAFPEVDEIVEEATLAILTTMRGPCDDGLRVSAARTLLDFYKAKPTAKQAITVNTAESWLSSLDADENEAQNTSND